MIKPYPLEPLVSRLISPLEHFLSAATSGGIVLIAATIGALALATGVGDAAIHDFWHTEIAIEISGVFRFHLTAHEWVNDALMAIFFLLVGLELKREILVGELSRPREAMLPVLAALGGMIVPALVYLAFNRTPETLPGWGIPMATDIAFALGILVMIANRVPRSLFVFITALAIADDLGAVLIIAAFYSGPLDMGALAAVGLVSLGLIVLNASGIRSIVPYLLLGVVLWIAMLQSGIHATIAGILLAFAIPARPARGTVDFRNGVREVERALASAPTEGRAANQHIGSLAEELQATSRAARSPLQRLEHRLGPWVTFGIIPIFALANAGIDLGAIQWNEALASPVTLGVLFGLLVGKFVGISAFSALAVGSKLAQRPSDITWRHITGAGWIAGIGFTMSLFIAQLAFDDPELIDEAKLGILLGSALSALIGLVWLSMNGSRPLVRGAHTR